MEKVHEFRERFPWNTPRTEDWPESHILSWGDCFFSFDSQLFRPGEYEKASELGSFPYEQSYVARHIISGSRSE